MEDNQALKAIADRLPSFRHDPYGYCMFSYPWGEEGGELEDSEGPRDWQRDVLDHIGSQLKEGNKVIRVAVASGHGIGKSALIAMILDWGISTHSMTKGVVTANTENQLVTKTWPELGIWTDRSLSNNFFKYEATRLSYDTDNLKVKKNWKIDMIPWSEKNTEAFAGLHNLGKRIIVVYDEASAIPDKIWEVTEGALTDKDTEIIWIVFGNPTMNTGRFRECFRKFQKRWYTKQIDSRNVDGTNIEQLNEWVEDYGEDSDFVKVRVRGMFPSAGSNQFIPTSYVDKAYGRELSDKDYSFAPVIIGCDPAWEGDDMLTIGMRQGLYSKELACIPKNDNDFNIATLLAQFEEDYKADMVCIDQGWGTGIYSAGKVLGRDWRLVSSASTKNVPDKGCLNMRSYMWKSMRDWLRDGGRIGKDQGLYDELISVETVSRSDGKIQIEPKTSIKKRLGRSTDKADWLGLTFAFGDLLRKSEYVGVKSSSVIKGKSNPHSRRSRGRGRGSGGGNMRQTHPLRVGGYT